MSFRYRKSVSIGKGLRLNISKTGVGLSAGTTGLRYSIHSSGRTTRTVGIPGTGVYYRKDSYLSRGRAPMSGSGRVTAVPSPVTVPRLKASFFAPRYEKEFVTGVRLAMRNAFADALPHFLSAREKAAALAISPSFWAGYCEIRLENRVKEAADYFQEVVASDMALPDELMTKYGVEAAVEVMVTPSLKVVVAFSTLGAALILAECYQDLGDLGKAIGVLEGLAEQGLTDSALTASLAELYLLHGDTEEVITVTNGTVNNDDVGCQTLILRAKALDDKGLPEAALESLKVAMRSRKRSDELLKAARYERALIYQRLGKTSQARKDFERLYAEDSSYADVRDRIGD